MWPVILMTVIWCLCAHYPVISAQHTRDETTCIEEKKKVYGTISTKSLVNESLLICIYCHTPVHLIMVPLMNVKLCWVPYVYQYKGNI